MNLELTYYKPDKIKKRFEKAVSKAKDLESLYSKSVEARQNSTTDKATKKLIRLTKVFDMRANQNMTFRKIGEAIGVTRQRALQLYREALIAACP